MKIPCIGVLLLGTSLPMVGCSGRPARVHPPDYAIDAGAAALAAYDTNSDGFIDGTELDQVPALLAALKQVDLNGDQRVSAEEIDGRVKVWQASRLGKMSVPCQVTLDGKPLADAQILFEPEPFLGPDMKPASGVSDESGWAGITMAAEHLPDPRYPGVAGGWYKIRVTHPVKQIPQRYNSRTELGCEVSKKAHWVGSGTVKLDLKTSAEK